MRSAPFGSIVTPWSPDWLERSPVRTPSSRMSTRSPSKPRMIGRLVPGPKLRLAMPGSFSIASPIVLAPSTAMSNESRVVTALNASSVVSAPPAEAVTVNSSWTADKPSSKFTVAVPPAATVTSRRSAVRCSRWAITSYEPAGTSSISNPPCSSVSPSAPAPTTRMTAPCTGPPLLVNVTRPPTAPVSCARAGIARKAAAATATAKRVAVNLKRIESPLSPMIEPPTAAAKRVAVNLKRIESPLSPMIEPP